MLKGYIVASSYGKVTHFQRSTQVRGKLQVRWCGRCSSRGRGGTPRMKATWRCASHKQKYYDKENIHGEMVALTLTRFLQSAMWPFAVFCFWLTREYTHIAENKHLLLLLALIRDGRSSLHLILLWGVEVVVLGGSSEVGHMHFVGSLHSRLSSLV